MYIFIYRFFLLLLPPTPTKNKVCILIFLCEENTFLMRSIQSEKTTPATYEQTPFATKSRLTEKIQQIHPTSKQKNKYWKMFSVAMLLF